MLWNKCNSKTLVTAARPDVALHHHACLRVKNLGNISPNFIVYEHPSIDALNTEKSLQNLWKTVYLYAVSKPLSICQATRMTNIPLRCTFPQPPDNSHTISIRNKHTIDPRNECRCYLIRRSRAATALLVDVKSRKYLPYSCDVRISINIYANKP